MSPRNAKTPISGSRRGGQLLGSMQPSRNPNLANNLNLVSPRAFQGAISGTGFIAMQNNTCETLLSPR